MSSENTRESVQIVAKTSSVYGIRQIYSILNLQGDELIADLQKTIRAHGFLSARNEVEETGFAEILINDYSVDLQSVLMESRTARMEGAEREYFGDLADVPVVLTSEEFAAIETFRLEIENCTICMFSLSSDKQRRIARLSCGHAFHRRCVKKWLCGHSAKCPLCKADQRVQTPLEEKERSF